MRVSDARVGHLPPAHLLSMCLRHPPLPLLTPACARLSHTSPANLEGWLEAGAVCLSPHLCFALGQMLRDFLACRTTLVTLATRQYHTVRIYCYSSSRLRHPTCPSPAHLRGPPLPTCAGRAPRSPRRGQAVRALQLTHRAHAHQPAAQAAPRPEDQESVRARAEGVLHDVALLQQAAGDKPSLSRLCNRGSARACTPARPSKGGTVHLWGRVVTEWPTHCRPGEN